MDSSGIPSLPGRSAFVRRLRTVTRTVADILPEVRDAVPVLPQSVFSCRFSIVVAWLTFRLIVYCIMLLPAFLPFVYGYFFDTRIKHRIRFGPERRNYVDIYVPREAVAAKDGRGPAVPVVVAVMGGAFVMGHRAWNTQLGLRLLDAGIITVGVDYRNFPIGFVPDMVEDVTRALGWVFENIGDYGGDPSNIVIHAQSAGAHLAALLLLERSLLESRDEEMGARWSVRDLKAFVGVSGPYDLVGLQPFLEARGILPSLIRAITVDGDLAGCSPTHVLDCDEWQASSGEAAALLPPIYLFHGDGDKTVPAWSTTNLAEGLRKAGVRKLTEDVRLGWTHTYPIIEAPMSGFPDLQLELILPFLLGEEVSRQRLDSLPKWWPMLPRPLVNLAGRIMPY